MPFHNGFVSNSSMGSQQLETRVFEELLDAEVLMNPGKLREAARQGIPHKYRGTVYRYLLGIASMDKSKEMTFEQMQEDDFKLLETAYVALYGTPGSGSGAGGDAIGTQGPPSMVRPSAADAPNTEVSLGTPWLVTPSVQLPPSISSGHVQCWVPKTPWDAVFFRCRTLRHVRDDPPLRRRMESALRGLRITHRNASFEEVDVMFAFVYAFGMVADTPWDVFHLTEALYSLMASNCNPLHSSVALREHCSIFLMLFHYTNEELYLHFHAEGVHALVWVPSYIRGLLAAQLHLDDHLRLMDFYLADCSETGAFPLHSFVCLSLLSVFTEALMEMDRAQIETFLHCLPRVDMEMVLQRALAVRETVLSRELL